VANFIEWSDELSVGIEEIDEQHKILVNLVNEMHQALHERRGAEITNDILRQLKHYTMIHFAVEESLMRVFHYPGYEIHKSHHQKLIEQINELQRKVEKGSHSISFELMHFLRTWLSKHIMEEDKAYRDCFLAGGVQPTMAKRSWVQRLWHPFD